MKIAMWCRHKGDAIIGIGPHIPWNLSSDLKRFKRVTNGRAIVVGQLTYESFPNRTLPNRRMYVLSLDPTYQVSDPTAHFVVSDVYRLNDVAEDLYISGGASVYKLMMSNDQLAPECVIDCCYDGPMRDGLSGPVIEIKSCVDYMETNYEPFAPGITEEGVLVRLMVRRDAKIPADQLAALWQRIQGV